MLGPILLKIRQRAEYRGFPLFTEGEICPSCGEEQRTRNSGPPYKYICSECSMVHCVLCSNQGILATVCEDCEKASAI